MLPQYTTRKDGNTIEVIDTENRIVATITPKGWETDFFNKKFGSLTLNNGTENISNENLNKGLDEMLTAADQSQFALIELVLEVKKINLIPLLEEKGFRLVDTKISYMTLIHKEKPHDKYPENGKVRLATRSDLPDLLDLTHNTLTYNPEFFSRFKNPKYFTEEESEKYYAAWIKNTLTDPDSLFAVYEHNQKAVGFFIYKYSGVREGKPVFKGILTAVAPAYRGNKAHLSMQAFLYEHIKQNDFYVHNATQLSNYPVIMNHVKSQKKLDKIELFFFRKPGDK